LKEIGILEYHYHSIFFYTIARICNTKQTNVTLFTTKRIYSFIEKHLENKKQYKIVLKKDNESINSFLKRVEKICNDNIDLLFINTIQESCKDLPFYLKFKPKCKMILTIHDANTWLKQKFTVNILRPFATIDTIISTVLINRFILKKFNAINVIYSPIKEYIINNTSYKKEVFTLPFTIFDNTKKITRKRKENTIKFIVPGAIIQTRRNNDVVLDAFENLFKRYKNKISLFLLGSPTGSYGQRIINRCKKMKEKNYNITFFEEYVPEEIYDKTLRECDTIIVPIKLATRSLGVIKETFGMTKASGVIFDAIQYAKPLIVPSEFKIIKEIQSSTSHYLNSEDLEKKIAELIKNKEKLFNLEKEAYKNSKNFSLNILQDYFIKNIIQKLNNL